MERLEDCYRPGFREQRIDPLIYRLAPAGRLASVFLWAGLHLLIWLAISIPVIFSLTAILMFFAGLLFLLGLALFPIYLVFCLLWPFSREMAGDWLGRVRIWKRFDDLTEKLFVFSERLILDILVRLSEWSRDHRDQSWKRFREGR